MSTEVPPMIVPLSRLKDESKLPVPADRPMATQTARQDMAIVAPADAFMVALKGGGSKERAYGINEPLGTVCASGNHHAVVTPPAFITRHNGTKGDLSWTATGVDEPFRTMTTKAGQSLTLIPPKMVMTYYGNGGVTPATQPMPTMRTRDSAAVIDPAELVDECLFRMLGPSEVGAAMAFPGSYSVLGTQRDRVRMYGNAVTPPASALLFDRVRNMLGAQAGELTVTDLFCGAGGSSIGIEQAGGVLRMAANHWQLAVDTHARNFPHADHDCANISETDPRRYPTTDILWGSPECTNHSQAKGAKAYDESAERSRATMWDIPRFTEAMQYRKGRKHKSGYAAILVENVVEVTQWVLFPAWRYAMESLGFSVNIVYLNSMHAHGKEGPVAPQSRDRAYIVCVPTGKAIDLEPRPQAPCFTCNANVGAVQQWKKAAKPGAELYGKYRQQYLYRCDTCKGQVEPYVLPAAHAIDWTKPGERIGSKRKPLAAATIKRIEAGLRKYARPQLVPAGGSWNETTSPIDEPMRTRTTRDSEALLVPPMVVRGYGTEGGDPARMCTPVDEPARTLTASGSQFVLTPPMVVTVGGNTHERPGQVRAKSVGDPMTTRTATASDAIVVPPGVKGAA